MSSPQTQLAEIHGGKLGPTSCARQEDEDDDEIDDSSDEHSSYRDEIDDSSEDEAEHRRDAIKLRDLEWDNSTLAI